MKKFLSLVLALVMTMSLVTVSAGAKDFTDNSKINYAEAVDVMSAVKVIDGYADGSFNPSATLTRGAAAKIICNLILGPTTASALVADAAPYKDVPVNHTFAGYIAYCQKEGIISGYADGTFKPANSLTGYAFMKMLLGALGYDAANEGYVGPNWSINVAKRAINVGLNDDLIGSFNGVKAVTREEACLYAFNTLKATMVEYTTQTIVVNNGSVSTNKTAKSMEWVGAEKAYDGVKDGKVQFCEKYFEKLTAKYDTDDFERPVTTWSNDKKEVGTYVRKDLLVEEYKGVEVTGADLYNLLGKSVVEDYDFNVAIDGITDSKIDSDVFNKTHINKNNKKAVGGTDAGVLTQVFQDTDSKEVYIAVINTYLAQAKKDYDTKKESADFTVYALKEVSGTGSEKEYKKTLTSGEDKETITVSNDDVKVEGVKEDGFYLVTVAKHAVQSVEAAKTVSDTEISSFKLGSSVTAGSTKYDYAATAEYDVDVLDNYSQNNMKETTYNIILDTYGNLIGVEEVDAEDNYVFITGVDANSSNLSKKNYDATAIFTDGTSKTITFKSDKGDIATVLSANPTKSNALVNTWFTYTTDKDGVYTLTAVADSISSGVKVAQSHDTSSTVIDKKNIALTGGSGYTGVYGNNATIYLTAELKKIVAESTDKKTLIISGVENVTTGVKNASIDLWNTPAAANTANGSYAESYTTTGVTSPILQAASGAYVLYKDNGYVIAAVVVGEDGEASKNLVYVNSSKLASESYDKAADEWTWTREAIYNGEKITLTEVGDSLQYIGTKAGQGNMQEHTWYQVKFNAKGQVIGADTVGSWSMTTATGESAATTGDYVTNIDYLAYAINHSKDTILYDGTNLTAAKMKGNTIYTDKAMTKGFYVDEDAKVVFIQSNDGKETTEYATGADEVQGFIDDLNADSTGAYKFDVSAILENGVAKTVIIRDQIDATYKPGVTPSTPVAATYHVEMMGCSAGSSNVQFVIKNDVTGKWLTPAEIEALNLTEDEIIVKNNNKAILLDTECKANFDGTALTSPVTTGTYFKKLGTTYTALQWDFAKKGSAIAVFGIDAYDGLTASPSAASIYGASAGYVKAHLAMKLSTTTGDALAVYIDRAGFTTVDGTVG